MTATDQWRTSDFKRMMKSSDVDYWINALNDLIEHLKTGKDISDVENNEEIYETVFKSYNTYIEKPEVSEERKNKCCHQVLVLLSTILDLSKLPKFIDQILTKALSGQDNGDYSKYLLVFIDILAAVSTSSRNRQDTYIKNTVDRCIGSLNPDPPYDKTTQIMSKIASPIQISKHLIENLGSFIPEKKYEEFKNKLIELMKDEDLSYTNEVSDLVNAWSLYCNDSVFQDFAKFLIKNVQHSSKVFFVLSSLVINDPLKFSSHLNSLVQIYSENITNLIYGSVDVSSSCVKTAEMSINCVNSIITAFWKRFVGSADYYCELCFDLIVYYISHDDLVSNSVVNQNYESEFASVDEEFVGFEDELQTDDEIYRVRKSANLLMQTLIKHFPDIFFSVFLRGSDEENCEEDDEIPAKERFEFYSVGLIIDQDSSSKSLGLQTLLLFARTKGREIPAKAVEMWCSAFINEISNPNQESFSALYTAFAEFLCVFPEMAAKYCDVVVERTRRVLQHKQKISSQQSQQIYLGLLNLLNVIMANGAATDKVAPMICEILSPMIVGDNNAAVAPALYCTTAVLLANAGNKSIKAFNSLNKEMVAVAKSKSASSIYTIDPLSIYVCNFIQVDKEGAKSALEAILDLNSLGKSYTKAVLSAVTLISFSPARDIVSTVSKEVTQIIHGSISSSSKEVGLLSRSLWAIYSTTVKKQLLSKEQYNSVIPFVIQLLSYNDNRIKKIVVKILKNLSSLELVTSSLAPQLNSFFNLNENIPIEVILIISDIFSSVKENELEKLVSSLVAEGKKFATMSGFESKYFNLSIFIGALLSTRANLKDKIFNEFVTEISNKDLGKINVFSLRCIGEIGFRYCLTENKSLIDRLFELSLCDDHLIFTSAVHSLGTLSANEAAIQTMVPQIVERMKKDEGRISKYVNILSKCLRRRSRSQQPKVAKLDLKDLFNYLLTVADYKKETKSTFVDCFTSILVLQPSLIDSYYKSISANNNSSPLLSLAISDYVGTFVQNAEDVKPILKKMIPFLNPNNPSVCTGAISTIKNSIKFEKICPFLATKFAEIAKCLEVNESQFTDIFYGSLVGKVDNGLLMRSAAVDAISSLYFVNPDLIDVDLMLSSLAKTFEDPSNEVISKTAAFLIRLSRNQNMAQLIIKLVVPSISEKVVKQDELQDAFLHLIANLKMASANAKCQQIEKLADLLNNKTLLTKYENDFVPDEQNLDIAGKDVSFTSREVCRQLIAKFDKDAVDAYFY